MKNTSTAALKKLVNVTSWERISRVQKDVAKAISKKGQRTYLREFYKFEGNKAVVKSEVVRNINFVELKKIMGPKTSVITKVYVDEKNKSRIDLFYVEIGQGDYIDQR